MSFSPPLSPEAKKRRTVRDEPQSNPSSVQQMPVVENGKGPSTAFSSFSFFADDFPPKKTPAASDEIVQSPMPSSDHSTVQKMKVGDDEISLRPPSRTGEVVRFDDDEEDDETQSPIGECPSSESGRTTVQQMSSLIPAVPDEYDSFDDELDYYDGKSENGGREADASDRLGESATRELMEEEEKEKAVMRMEKEDSFDDDDFLVAEGRKEEMKDCDDSFDDDLVFPEEESKGDPNESGDEQMPVVKKKAASFSSFSYRSPWDCTPFPFLDLPNELIVQVMGRLPMKDRMRLRLNKRLNALELESKYFVKNLNISDTHLRHVCCKRHHFLYLRKTKSYSTDFIKRITQNVSFGTVEIKLTGSGEFHREVYNSIKDFHSKKMHITFPDIDTERAMMSDSLFLEWSNRFKSLEIDNDEEDEFVSDKISPEAMHKVYKKMMEGSIDLRKLCISASKNTQMIFLKLLGVTFHDDTVSSSKGLEVYSEDDPDDYDDTIHNQNFSLFDGNLQINVSMAGTFNNNGIRFKFHKTSESAGDAKSELFEVDVV